MSENKKGKKRPKSYYIKCAKGKKQKRVNDLDIGMKGFLVTCNTHEKEAVRESYNILNEYADKIYGPEAKPAKVANSDSDTDSDDDMEKAMAKEASAIKDMTPVERRFQNVDCKAKNCIFIKTNLISPTDLAHTIFTDLEEKKTQKARYAIRMLPIAATCKAVMKNIEDTAEKLFKPFFETEFGVGLRYTSLCKIRNNQNVSRMAILPSLGRIIKEMNPLHTLCYDEPDLVVLVEVIRNICCLSVVRDFFRFRKYNLHEVIKSSNDSTNFSTVEADCPVNNEENIKVDDNCEQSPVIETSDINTNLASANESSPNGKEENILIHVADKSANLLEKENSSEATLPDEQVDTKEGENRNIRESADKV